MSIELRFCTIISNDGITIFHRTFVEDDLDEYLFSGFSSAMIAFSRELGDSLSMIKMEKQTIFYHEAEEDGFLILSITKGYDVAAVQQKIKELYERSSLDLLLAGSKLGIVQNENEKFERDLFEIFNINTSSPLESATSFDLNQENEYAPPETNLEIPRSSRRDGNSQKKKKQEPLKTLEEQLEEEADDLEKYLQDEDKKSKEKDDMEEFMDALEKLDF